MGDSLYYDTLLNNFFEIENQEINEKVKGNLHKELKKKILNKICKEKRISSINIPIFIHLWNFFKENSRYVELLKLIPQKEVKACNSHRQKMIECNRPVPCFACNYYSRSMRILMRGMFNCEIFDERKEKNCSVFIIMEKLLVKGTSRSLRQDYVIQLAEILDCRANVLFSCATENSNLISPSFLKNFLSFLKELENKEKEWDNKMIKDIIDELENKCGEQISKLEECIIYYWEASQCFSIANDLMKASSSLKKILRVLQNYLKTADENAERLQTVHQNIDDIKKVFVKPCLIYLYSHYNNINFAEIQKLKWVFSIQSFEDIPLNRLSLFPDVEQILLLYYDLLRRCITVYPKIKINKSFSKWQKLLSKIYRNTTLGTLRQDSTIYERVMALRFKTLMNRDFLYNLGFPKNLYYHKEHEKGFAYFFLDYIGSNSDLSILLGEFRYCFRFALMMKKDTSSQDEIIRTKLNFLEYLVKDSLFCLTRILEIITPHTSSTLFSNSFYGEIYQMVYEWYMLFDELFLTYKYMEMDEDTINEVDISWRTFFLIIKTFKKIEQYRKQTYIILKSYLKKKSKGNILNSERFFNETTHEIGKAQANYTFAKYSLAMAKESYERALQMHHEGKAYKDMISQMYYLDDDLKNDTIQFSSAIERYKINNDYIQEQLEKINGIIGEAPMYEIDNYTNENMSNLDLENRFYLQ